MFKHKYSLKKNKNNNICVITICLILLKVYLSEIPNDLAKCVTTIGCHNVASE